MKYLFFTSVFICFIAILLGFSVPGVFAVDKTPKLSVSDAVYADLALRHNLDSVSISFIGANKADSFTLQNQKQWLPASTVKTYAAMYAYKLITDGKLHLSDTVTIDPKNNVTTELVTDELPTLMTGEVVTIDRLIRQMITQSDNTAFNTLLDVLGRDNITNYVVSLGLKNTHIGSKLNLDDSQVPYEYSVSGYGINTTTSDDYAYAFSLIKNNKISGAKDLYDVLLGQKINNMIPYFLPKTVRCAHKTGDLDPLYHDGGICADKKQSYILTIFTNAGDPALIAHLSEIIYTKNYNLVGAAIQPSTVSFVDHPIDQLALTQPTASVLGATTNSKAFSVPSITTSDLGISPGELSLVLSSSHLPSVVIPADSPFHGLSDAWQVARLFVAPSSSARLAVNIDIAKLRLAEAKDLLAKGKTQEAQTTLDSIQNGLTVLSTDPTVAKDPAVQATLQAVSETKFAILGSVLQKTTGDAKIALIQDIANQAKQTVQQIQPRLPDAPSAINPAQKPLIGQVTATSPTTVTIKTSGGQTVTVPTDIKSVTLSSQQQVATGSSPLSQNQASTAVSLIPSPTEQQEVPLIGSTVAIVGMQGKNNHFIPSLLVTNVPQEFVAPVPVTVAKVDTKHQTMVVVENGVYTQVNINPNTIIKGSDTEIPLQQIHPGDVVVVHGEPLATIPSTPAATVAIPSPKISVTPLISITLSPTIPAFHAASADEEKSSVSTGSSSVHNATVSIIPSFIPGGKSTSNTSAASSIKPSSLPEEKKAHTVGTNSQTSLPTPSTIGQPHIIQSTSVQVIEKKQSMTLPPTTVTTVPTKTSSSTSSSPPSSHGSASSSTTPQTNTATAQSSSAKSKK